MGNQDYWLYKKLDGFAQQNWMSLYHGGCLLFRSAFLFEERFMFMGTDERLRYESKAAATVAMYYDLKQINV